MPNPEDIPETYFFLSEVVSDSGVWESVSMSADGSVMGATKMSSKLWTSSDSGATWAEDATSPDAWMQI